MYYLHVGVPKMWHGLGLITV